MIAAVRVRHRDTPGVARTASRMGENRAHGAQDPGTNEEIGAFCQKNYGVSFPMMAKIDVNGKDAHPIFDWLKDQKGGLLIDGIKWNFTKFLIGTDGQVIDRYAPTTKPDALKADIEQALAAK